METTLKINKVESATSQKGKEYFKIHTDEGIMSCFEKEVSQNLFNKIGESVNVIVAESNGYKNIRGLGSDKPIKEKVGIPAEVPKETKGYFPKVSREKLAEGLALQVTNLVCYSNIKEEEAVKLVEQVYDYFLRKVSAEWFIKGETPFYNLKSVVWNTTPPPPRRNI